MVGVHRRCRIVHGRPHGTLPGPLDRAAPGLLLQRRIRSRGQGRRGRPPREVRAGGRGAGSPDGVERHRVLLGGRCPIRRGCSSLFTAAIVEGLETGEADRDHDGMVSIEDPTSTSTNGSEPRSPARPQRCGHGESSTVCISPETLDRLKSRRQPLPPELQAEIESPPFRRTRWDRGGVGATPPSSNAGLAGGATGTRAAEGRRQQAGLGRGNCGSGGSGGSSNIAAVRREEEGERKSGGRIRSGRRWSRPRREKAREEQEPKAREEQERKAREEQGRAGGEPGRSKSPEGRGGGGGGEEGKSRRPGGGAREGKPGRSKSGRPGRRSRVAGARVACGGLQC